MSKVRVAVIGAAGYSGEELVKTLCRHPQVQVTYVSGKEERQVTIADLFPYLRGTLELPCKAFDFEEAVAAADIFFLCLPHTASMQVVPALLTAKKLVVDLSADYRLKDIAVYEQFYKTPHGDPDNLSTAIYGLPELNREAIAKAKLVANPGCYPTGAILGLCPALRAALVDPATIIIDAKSGVTGAGRKADKALNFSEINESFKAYKLFEHQHVPEINQELGKAAGKPVDVVFVPHLLPVSRGILCTIYARTEAGVTTDTLSDVYQRAYQNEPFVKVMPRGVLPELRHVQHTNLCNIGLRVDPVKKLAVIITAIDNLGKGAATQAVQNMNLMCGFDERQGLGV